MGFFDNYVDDLNKKVTENAQPTEGDYVVEGILYCGKCKTPKQTRVVLMGKERVVGCVCKCKAQELEREKEEEKRREKEDRIKRLRRMGFSDPKMMECTLENDDGSNQMLSTVAKNFVENFDTFRKNGKGLLLFGNVGSGKTYIAAAIANALIDKGIPCLITNFPRLINTIQGMQYGKQEYIDGLNQFDLLVIDDLASERNTEYMNEMVYNIIDARNRSGLPLIVTTNLTSEELKNAVDISKQRVFSRLFEMTKPIEVKGKDRRRQILKDDDDETSRLLGLK